MKLRVDLLEHLTDQDILEEVLANNPRYKPEPNFSKTGVGSLSSASIEERAQEEARSTALIERLKKRATEIGRKSSSESSASTKRLNSCGTFIAAPRFSSSTATRSPTWSGNSQPHCLLNSPPPAGAK